MEMLDALQKREQQNIKDIDAQLNLINKQLIQAKKGSEQEYCLLYTKSELLDLQYPYNHNLNAQKNVSSAGESDVYLESVAPVAPLAPIEPIAPIAINDAIENPQAVAVNTEASQKEVKKIYELGNSKQVKYLRGEVKRLQRDVQRYQDLAKVKGYKIIRDTVKIEIEKPVISYVDRIVEVPVVKYVDKIVEKPVVQYVDKVVEKPVVKYIDNVIEKTKTITKVEQLLSLPPDVILFDIGKHNIKAQYVARLKYYATQLKTFNDLEVTLTGHTDATGNAKANEILSAKRALAVKTFLLNQGVKNAQINIASEGPNDPAADNTSASGKAQNRRVALQFNK